MTVPFAQMQRVVAYVARHLEEDLSLAALSSRADLSPYHLHRVFSNAVGETPKHLTFRLRLARAAVLLLTTDDSLLDVSLSCGFQSHEVFCRAFRRRFGMTPRSYRERGFAQEIDASQSSDHAELVSRVAPCIGLYHMSEEAMSPKNNMTYSITKKHLSPQPVLIVRRKVKRSEIAATIGESLGRIFAYAQQHGIALAGVPFTRYPEMGPGLITMEPGMPIASAHVPDSSDPDVLSDTLPGGPVATTTHAGPYDTLPDAYAAIQQWMEAEGQTAAGAPWESYLTDPAEHPDPKDWKTEVFWPLAQ